MVQMSQLMTTFNFRKINSIKKPRQHVNVNAY